MYVNLSSSQNSSLTSRRIEVRTLLSFWYTLLISIHKIPLAHCAVTYTIYEQRIYFFCWNLTQFAQKLWHSYNNSINFLLLLLFFNGHDLTVEMQNKNNLCNKCDFPCHILYLRTFLISLFILYFVYFYIFCIYYFWLLKLRQNNN